MSESGVCDEMVTFLAALDYADGSLILSREQAEDVAFALAANVDLGQRFYLWFGMEIQPLSDQPVQTRGISFVCGWVTKQH